jgi:hypothetical protein
MDSANNENACLNSVPQNSMRVESWGDISI